MGCQNERNKSASVQHRCTDVSTSVNNSALWSAGAAGMVHVATHTSGKKQRQLAYVLLDITTAKAAWWHDVLRVRKRHI